MRNVSRFLPLLILAALAVAAVCLGLPARLMPERLLADASDFLGLASSRPLTTFALLALLVTLVSAIGLPGGFAVFAATGFLLGTGPAMLAAALGTCLGNSALMLALTWAFFGEDQTPRADQGTLARLRRDFDRHPFTYALAMRALPMLPNGVVTATLAALRCPWPSFLAASALGPQLNALPLGWLGAELAWEVRAGRPLKVEMLSRPGVWLPMLAVLLLALLPSLLRRGRRAVQDAGGDSVKGGYPNLPP